MANENFTAQQWIKYFMDKIGRGENYTVDEIREVVKTISVKDPVAARDAVTVFYSGEGSSFPKGLSETAGGEIRMIDRTEACKFLTHKDFETILEEAIKFENEAARKDPNLLKSIKERVLYPGSEGSVSNALPDRIFATDELKTLLETLPDGAKICGFDAAGGVVLTA